jgi:hypothetical protein
VVRTRIYISLFVIAACFGSIGCNPGIIDVPPTPVTDAAAYFWKGSMAPVTFSDVDSNGVRKSTFSLSFYSGDSNTFIIRESNSNSSKPDSLICSVNGDAVNIKGLSPHSILPIPDGYAVKPNIIVNQHYVTPISFTHILAVPDISVVATTETGVYYSPDTGKSWTQFSVPFGSNRDTVTALTYIGQYVFAGTSSGDIYQSTTSGATWSHSTISSFHNPILAIATDPNSFSLFISAGQAVYSWEIGGAQPVPILSNSLKTFTSLAFSLDSIDSNILVGGTVNDGLWYRAIGSKDSAWHQVTNTPEKNASVKSLISTSQGFYCSTTTNIYATVGGMDWKPPTPSAFPNAILTYDLHLHQVIAANHGGSILKISDDLNHKIITSTPRIPSNSVNDISALYPNYYAATDSGIFRMATGGQTWQPVFGSGDFFADTIKLAGEISLLHSVTGSNSSDSSWAADTLINNNTKSTFPFTARLIDHFSSIMMPDSTSYNDVIEVQYTAGGTNQVGIPAGCQIFYAKDVGPIIIREIYANFVIRRIYRLRN